ncbi:MAG TPA: HupE/UreJ family protein, partial [Kofleriaceae bacterium]|nr:HupE/UreJ family protein [Kofleriaceae bacterium]
MRAPLIFAAILVIATGRAAAHQTSVKYVDVTVDGARAEVKLTVAPGDVTEPLGLPADARPAVDAALTPAVAGYVARWLALGATAEAACPAGAPRVHADPDRRFVVVEWSVTCAVDLGHLALDFRPFFAVDARHEAIVTVHAPGEPGEAKVVRAAEPILQLSETGDVGLAGWVAAGVQHIWDGRDHVCFVIALLLVVMLRRDGDGDGDWATRPPLATLRRTATIITAFTVAHSLSLIAASLGWL